MIMAAAIRPRPGMEHNILFLRVVLDASFARGYGCFAYSMVMARFAPHPLTIHYPTALLPCGNGGRPLFAGCGGDDRLLLVFGGDLQDVSRTCTTWAAVLRGVLWW